MNSVVHEREWSVVDRGVEPVVLWIAFIGWFLENAATAQVQQQIVGNLLAGHTASEAMNPHYVSIPAATHLQETDGPPPASRTR